MHMVDFSTLRRQIQYEPPIHSHHLLCISIDYEAIISTNYYDNYSIPLNMETFVRNSSYVCRLRIVLPCNARQFF